MSERDYRFQAIERGLVRFDDGLQSDQNGRMCWRSDPDSPSALRQLDATETRAVAVELEGMVAALREQLATAQRERDEAITILRPSMPESGLVDACKQRMQTLVVALDNEKKAMELYDQQRERADRLDKSLHDVEWGPLPWVKLSECPRCLAYKRDGHNEGCELSAALRGEPTAPSTAHPPCAACGVNPPELGNPAGLCVRCSHLGAVARPPTEAPRDEHDDEPQAPVDDDLVWLDDSPPTAVHPCCGCSCHVCANGHSASGSHTDACRERFTRALETPWFGEQAARDDEEPQR